MFLRAVLYVMRALGKSARAEQRLSAARALGLPCFAWLSSFVCWAYLGLSLFGGVLVEEGVVFFLAAHGST